MKKLIITLAAFVALASCTKKTDNPVPTTPVVTNIDKTKIEAQSKAGNPRYLDITVSYANTNDSKTYNEDVVIATFGDSVIYTNHIGAVNGPTTIPCKSADFPNTQGWKVYLTRITGSKVDTISTVSGF